MAAKTKAAPKKSTKVGIRPLGERMLVQRVEAEAKSAGGILLPESAKEKPKEGIVIALGEGRMLESGERADCWRPRPLHELRRHGRQVRRSGVPDHGRARHPRGHQLIASFDLTTNR